MSSIGRSLSSWFSNLSIFNNTPSREGLDESADCLSSKRSFQDIMFDSKDFFQKILLNGIHNGKYFLPEHKEKFKKWGIGNLQFPVDQIYYDMKGFVMDEKKFNEFYFEFVQLLDSISSGDGVGDEFYLGIIDRLVQILTNNGFDTIPRDKQISFWTGKDVKEFIFNDESKNDILADLKIPAYIVLFELAGHIFYGDEIKFSNDAALTFRRIVCKHLASQAKKNVNVYVSSDDLLKEDFIRVGNYFWQFELPVLQNLKQNGIIQKINFIFFDSLKKSFKKPIEISSDKAMDLKLLRFVPFEIEISNPRTLYSVKSTKIDFVPDKDSIKTKLTIGKLKDVIEHWKEFTRSKSIEKKDSLEVI